MSNEIEYRIYDPELLLLDLDRIPRSKWVELLRATLRSAYRDGLEDGLSKYRAPDAEPASEDRALANDEPTPDEALDDKAYQIMIALGRALAAQGIEPGEIAVHHCSLELDCSKYHNPKKLTFFTAKGN